MAKPKKGLGGGLGSLLGLEEAEFQALDQSPGASVEAVEGERSTPSPEKKETGEWNGVGELRLIDLSPNPDQPRREFDEESLAELSESIRRNGVLQPILVRRMEGRPSQYCIIAGERRWRAARMAGLDTIPAVLSEADDAKSAELALIENLQREDLNPVEEAKGFQALANTYGLKQEEIAERVGRSRPAVTNALRLLSLDGEVLEMLASGAITPGHARALISLSPAEQVTLAERAAADGLSVRQVETLAARLAAAAAEEPDPAPSPVQVDYTAVLAREIGERIGRKVRITSGKRKGRMEIEFYGNDDLNALCELLRKMGGAI